MSIRDTYGVLFIDYDARRSRRLRLSKDDLASYFKKWNAMKLNGTRWRRRAKWVKTQQSTNCKWLQSCQESTKSCIDFVKCCRQFPQLGECSDLGGVLEHPLCEYWAENTFEIKNYAYASSIDRDCQRCFREQHARRVEQVPHSNRLQKSAIERGKGFSNISKNICFKNLRFLLPS